MKESKNNINIFICKKNDIIDKSLSFNVKNCIPLSTKKGDMKLKILTNSP